ncbi:MAG: RNA-binding domain-containing protein [Anaerolineae bacterium]
MPARKKSHKSNSTVARQWRKMDLHLHTPASVDYREPNATYLDFLKKAEEKGLDIVAFTDHNTVAGYERYLNEVESLILLERLNRLTDVEREQLSEYRRLQDKLLILPGFEITATLGFHILGIFSPDTSVRELEHLLLNLKVPPDKLDLGSGEVGATSDVLTIYRTIDEAGGLVVAAHANSSHGVAMPGFDFGGQTRISYTQDSHLHALEVTDLTSKSRRRTALFFSGTKPEYPRRMHLTQASDAHRLSGLAHNNQELGVGDRATEILLDELSFEAIKEVFLGNDFAKVRPYVPSEPTAFDPISQAREEGDTLVQAFHEQLIRGRGIERKILQDLVALANTNGGTIYVGLSANTRQPILGVQRPGEGIHQLRAEINKSVIPPLEVQLDAQKLGAKSVIRVIVPRGSEVPYALDGTQIYVRSENETSLAVRDEIVNLVRDSVAIEFAAKPVIPEPPLETGEPAPEPIAPPALSAPPPHTGVQVIPAERRKGELQYTVRDLRNNRLIHNVTRSSARKLWQYAISDYEEHPVDAKQVKWQGEIGLCKAHKRAGKVRYDLVQRDSSGEMHIYYGVTEDGIHGPWKALIEAEGLSPEIEVDEEHTEDNGEHAESFEEMALEQFVSLSPEESQAPQWLPLEMLGASEQDELMPGEMDVDLGESPSASEMGFQVESIPETASEPSPDNALAAEQTLTAEQPEEAQPENEASSESQGPAPLHFSPGRSMLPPLSAGENRQAPLDISPDTNTMGEHQGMTAERHLNEEKNSQAPDAGGSSEGISPSSESNENPSQPGS